MRESEPHILKHGLGVTVVVKGRAAVETRAINVLK